MDETTRGPAPSAAEGVERWVCGGCGWGLVAGRGERERVMDKVLAHEVEGGRGHRVRKVLTPSHNV